MPSGHRPPIPPGIARVALSGLFYDHKWANVFYLQLTGTGITASDLNTLATDIASSWNTNIAPSVDANVTLSLVTIVFVPSVGNEITGSASVSHPGTNTASPQDAGLSLVVNWNISAYYRGGHPRWYVPGVPESAITNGSDISSAATSSRATSYAALRTAINGFTTTNISGVSFGTLSFSSGNAWRGTPLFRPFTGVTIRSKIGSQRRRILS